MGEAGEVRRMHIQNPAMYWAFLLIVLPLLIHFLFKRRYQTYAFGAMTVLRMALARRKDRILLEQVLMIGTRVLLLACLAAALLHPVLGDKVEAAREDQTCMVLLFDNSYSMLAGEGLSRMERAKFAGANLMDALRPGDEAYIVPAAEPKRIPGLRPFRDPGDAKAAVQMLNTAWKPRDLPAAVLAAAELFSRTPISRRELFIFTDPQALGFGSEEEARWQAVADALKQLDPMPRVFWVEPGMRDAWGESSENLGVVPPRASSSVVHAGEPLILHVQVRNSGVKPVERADVVMKLDGEPHSTQRLALQPGMQAQARFSCIFPDAGPHRVNFQVQTDEDLLVEDNTVLHAVKAEERLPVLLVDGNLTPEPLHNESDLARYALNPPPIGAEKNAPYAIQVVSPAELHLLTQLRKKYSAIVFMNVFEPDEALINRLEQYVGSGGGLMFVLGDRTGKDYYNKYLYRDGRGLLPCELLAKGGDEANLEKFETPHIGEAGHPALSALGKEEAQLDRVRVRAWHRVKVPQHLNETSAVLTLAPSGDPLLLARPFGRGSLYVLTTGLNVSWSDFPIHPSYQLLVRGLVDSLHAAQKVSLNLEVGQPLRGQFAFEQRGARHTLTAPDGEERTLNVRRKFGLDLVNESIPTPGWYTLVSGKDGHTAETFYAVNPDPRESDLTPVARETRESVANLIGARRVSGWEDLESLFQRARRGIELWWLLLACVAGFAAFEVLLARHFTRSFVDDSVMKRE